MLFLRKLSSTHIAYRLYKRGSLINILWEKLREFYKKKLEESRGEEKKKSKDNDGGPNYYIVKNYKLGSLVGFSSTINIFWFVNNNKSRYVVRC